MSRKPVERDKCDPTIGSFIQSLEGDCGRIFLEEFRADGFLFTECEDPSVLLPDNHDNLVDRSVNIVSGIDNQWVSLFIESGRGNPIEVVFFRQEICPQVFLEFLEQIQDDVDDEDDSYISPYATFGRQFG